MITSIDTLVADAVLSVIKEGHEPGRAADFAERVGSRAHAWICDANCKGTLSGLNTSGAQARYVQRSNDAGAGVWTAAEFKIARQLADDGARKCLEKVHEMSNRRDRMLDAALAVILAGGVPRESLLLEHVVGLNEGRENEVRIKQLARPAAPVMIGEIPPGVVLARVWLSFDMQTLTITQHYEGPPLKDFTP